jgi:molybdenum cofactor cytidylyltransferase
MIWAVILAAGESKRIGRPKLLLPLAGKTIIEKVVAEALSSNVDNTLLVLGAYHEKIIEKMINLPVSTVVNSQFSQGMLSSVQLGFRSLPQGTRAAVVLLGDQPSVSRTVINGVILAYEESQKGIVLPTFKKERGHPVLIDLKFQREIENLAPDVGLRGVVYSHPEDICEVPVKNPGILKDIDTLEDYKRALKSQNR